MSITLLSQPSVSLSNLRPANKGKFIYHGYDKLYIRGVTYGTFRPDESGKEFHDPKIVQKDFAQGQFSVKIVGTFSI